MNRKNISFTQRLVLEDCLNNKLKVKFIAHNSVFPFPPSIRKSSAANTSAKNIPIPIFTAKDIINSLNGIVRIKLMTNINSI